MFEPIYEIRLAGRDVKINYTTWDLIREHVRNNIWFYVVYLDTKYKYVKDHEFVNRPTRFDFDIVNSTEDDRPHIIYINGIE